MGKTSSWRKTKLKRNENLKMVSDTTEIDEINTNRKNVHPKKNRV